MATELVAAKLDISELCDKLPIATAVLNQEKTVLMAGQAWHRFFLKSSLNLLHFAELFPYLLDRGMSFNASFARILSKESVFEEIVNLLLWPDGSFEFIRWSLKYYQDALVIVSAVVETELHYYKQCFEISPDLIAIADKHGKFLGMNHSGLELLGYDEEMIVGRSCVDFMCPDDHQKTKDVIERLKQNKTVKGFTNRFIHKNGKIIWIEWSSHFNPNTQVICGIGRDVTAHISQEQSIKQTNNRLDALSYLQEKYIAGADIRELFQEALDKLLFLTGSEFGLIGRVLHTSKGNPYLKTYAISNAARNEALKALHDRHAPYGLEFHNLDNLFGYTVKTGKSVLSNNPSKDPRSGGRPEGHPYLQAYLGLPLVGAKGLIGMVGVANRPGGYAEQIIYDIEPLTRVLAAIIEAHTNAEAVEKLAHYDFVTELYNRAYFEKQLEQIILDANAQGDRFALIYLDLDKFKNINDTMGHKVGDLLLLYVSKRLKAIMREYDVLGRLGGDEFGIIVRSISDVCDVRQVVEKISNSLQSKFKINNCEVSVGVSIGVVIYPDAAKTSEQLHKSADFALYHCKNQHLLYKFYSKDIELLRLRRLAIENEVDGALDDGQFYFLFQPQVHLQTGKITGFEALLRWQHKALGVILPHEFIPVIEDLGKMDRLNLWVVNKAIVFQKQFFENCQSTDIYRFSVNLSPKVIDLKNNFGDIVDCLKVSACKMQNFEFEFEITETGVFDAQELDTVLSQFKEVGVTIAIDDFGIAYSSLSRLRTLPVQTLKIDMSFIKVIVTDDKTQHIVRAIIELSKLLQLTIIAEGVEEKAQYDVLKALGCHVGQGFYFYKPLSFDEALALLIQSQSEAY